MNDIIFKAQISTVLVHEHSVFSRHFSYMPKMFDSHMWHFMQIMETILCACSYIFVHRQFCLNLWYIKDFVAYRLFRVYTKPLKSVHTTQNPEIQIKGAITETEMLWKWCNCKFANILGYICSLQMAFLYSNKYIVCIPYNSNVRSMQTSNAMKHRTQIR